MSTVVKPKGVCRSNAVRALLRGRFIPAAYGPAAESITDVAPVDGAANVTRTAGQSLTELADDPSPRLVNLLEQQNPRSVTAKADARRVEKLLKSSTGVRSVLRSR